MALLVAVLVVMPTAAQSAVWVGGELGGNFITPTLMQVQGADAGNTQFSSSVLGGVPSAMILSIQALQPTAGLTG